MQPRQYWYEVALYAKDTGMKFIKRLPFFTLTLFTLTCGLLLQACDQTVDNTNEKLTTAKPIPSAKLDKSPANNIKTDSDNSKYLFDVTDHSLEELQELLQRAEEITKSQPDGFKDLEIVLILHGPDINMFTLQNYEKNRPLVDLAAKLDAFDIIDLRICETAMSIMGISRNDVPPFIESVPYAPAEINRLTDEGYINL